MGGDDRGWGGPPPECEKGAALWPPAGVGRAVEVQAHQYHLNNWLRAEERKGNNFVKV